MKQDQMNFVDKPDAYGPFEGIFLVFNIGQDNYSSIDLPPAYEDSLTDALANAHADGWAVFYLFDNTLGASPPPEHFDVIEDVDFPRLMQQTVGVPKAELSRSKTVRQEQLTQMLEHIWSNDSFRFMSRNAAFGGVVTIEGNSVLFPVTEI